VNDLFLIRKNLFRKKLRAILMMVSILIAFAIFGVLAGFERAFHAGQDAAAADRLVTVNKINFTQPLPYAYYNRVRGVDGVRQVTLASWFGGYYQEPKNFLVVMAVQPESYMAMYGNELDFTDEVRRAFMRERTGALVGESAARKWGWKVGDRVPIGSNIFTQKNGLAHLGPRYCGHHQEQGAAGGYHLHVDPVRLFQRDPVIRHRHGRLAGAAYGVAGRQ
jgi:putative ABC transport system permease protein